MSPHAGASRPFLVALCGFLIGVGIVTTALVARAFVGTPMLRILVWLGVLLSFMFFPMLLVTAHIWFSNRAKSSDT
jgi:uncharacterized membrane protein